MVPYDNSYEDYDHGYDNNATLENVTTVDPDQANNAGILQSPKCHYSGDGYNYDYYGTDYHSDTNCSYMYNDSYSNYEHKIFLYEGFTFERPIYTYIWEILVILTTLFNVVVIVVFLRKKMRNVLHMVLVAIAISDSLTGLVTLPTYIYTYSHYEPGGENSRAAYVLDKHWCNAFMISKFFLSKWFHTVSIWLTLFLGAQRFVSVLILSKTQNLFTMRNTLIFICLISVLSPVLHIYHVIHQKADAQYGLCHWVLRDGWAFVQLWATLLFMHLIPCLLLVVMTFMMIYKLFNTLSNVKSGVGTNKSMAERRSDRNRRVSIIVSTIVIVFLIPEVPFAIFLLITLVQSHSGNGIMSLDVNRGFHAVYEILLVLSFHANFWIYTVLNKRFRTELKKTMLELKNMVFRLAGKPIRKLSVTSSSDTGGRTTGSNLSERTGIKLRDLSQSNSGHSKIERNLLKESSSGQAEKGESV